ncbi:DUF1266 domain-containing protein [Providencia rettgeri]|uniref:DUF1266 domain-containing protein n=1 Tax=Providencia rettgeri TaxID=587 RepID=UPI0034E0D467
MSVITIAVGAVLGLTWAVFSNKKTRKKREQSPPSLYSTSELDSLEVKPLQPEEWGLFLNLPYSCFNGHAYNDYEPGPHDGGLKQAWGITNRYDLIYQLYILITSGHTDAYYTLRDRVAYADEYELEVLTQEIKNSEDSEENKREQLWQVEMMINNINGIRDVKYIAWDFTRFSKLCLDGCRAGYITKQEAQDWSLITTSMIKRIYSSWDDFWMSFVNTRWFWAATDTTWTEDQQDFADKIKEILADERFPTTQENWEMDLPSLNLDSFTRAVAGLGFTYEDGTPVSLPDIEARISYRLLPKSLNS